MHLIKKNISTSILLVLLVFPLSVWAQNADSLLNSLTDVNVKPIKVRSTFKGTHVVFSQSVEGMRRGDLNFIIRHNFGDIGGTYGGSHSLYGLDAAFDIFFGFDYGISDRLQLGIGRSREFELYDLNLKYKLLQQTLKNEMPITLSLFGQVGVNTSKSFSTIDSARFSSLYGRTSYFYQLIIAKKFGERLSLQVMPSFLYQVHPIDNADHARMYSLGFAGRLKITKRFALIGDYQLVNVPFLGRTNPSLLSTTYYNPLGLGFEIETGGHVFTIQFQNSEYIIENNFIPNTGKSWKSGGVRLAFAIGRVFTLASQKGVTNKSSVR